MSRPSKPQSKKAGRIVRKTLADGTVKEYEYKAYRKKPSPRLESDSVASLIIAYRASPDWAALAPGTIDNRSRYLRHLDAIGHHKVAEIEKRHIIVIRNGIAAASGNGAGTMFAKAASALFNWAVEAGWITHSPTYRMKALPGGAWQAWTPEQAETALASLPEHYRRVVVLGLYTGQRRADLCNLRWSDYDGKTLRIVQLKTGAKVTLTVHPDLKAELDAWPRCAETILTNALGKQWKAPVLTQMLPHQLSKLGLPPGLNVHGMRKLFAAGMAGAGATTHQIAANTGHKTLSMIQHYTVTADQEKLSAGAVDKIQTYTTARKSLK